LVITRADEPEITVDDIEVAQFVYLLLHNKKIRKVIDTITSKAVLILGRFTEERKKVLDALREELRNLNLLPILFDFAIPASRDVTETIKTLASLARFVIADVMDATEVRVELHNIASLPIQLILLRGHAKGAPAGALSSLLGPFPMVSSLYQFTPQRIGLLGALVSKLRRRLASSRRSISARSRWTSFIPAACSSTVTLKPASLSLHHGGLSD
jgi:hypothetical protein